MREFVEQVLAGRDERLRIHDFRMKEKEGETQLLFDLVLPDQLRGEETEIEDLLKERLRCAWKKDVCLEITFDPEEEEE